MQKAIGGYFELEIPRYEEYHKDALRLNSGKNCLEYILRVRKYSKVYVPYYTCSSVLEPLKKLSVQFDFYHVDYNFEIAEEIQLHQNEALLYTNYYGLKQEYTETLANKYGGQLIVDSTQAFFNYPINGIDTFYTCRKFFGVPDGAYLYIDKKLDMEISQSLSYHRFLHLIKRIDLSPEMAFEDYHDGEKNLSQEEIMEMSKLTRRILESIDYKQVALRRRNNYLQLHQVLSSTNNLSLNLKDDDVPMVYPYLPNNGDLRGYLIKNKVYVAKYWPCIEQWTNNDCIDLTLAKNMLPIPIDQRYGDDEMNRIIYLINNYIEA